MSGIGGEVRELGKLLISMGEAQYDLDARKMRIVQRRRH